MRKLFISFCVLIVCSKLWAQDSTLVTIKSGSRVTDVLSPSQIYLYPQFIEGKVIFRDDTKGAAKMNYNLLYDQMLFIDPKGDTMALDDEKTIKFIAVEKDTFYFDGGYIRSIAGNGEVRLAEKQNWVLADIRKIGTHNKQATTVAVTSFSSYTNGSDAAKSKDLILNEDILLRKETHFYFGDKFNHFARASKKGLLQLFGKDEQAIENFLKENKISFDKKEDLEKIIQFVGNL